MRLQADRPAVAILEGVRPSHAMVCRGDGEEHGIHPMQSAIHLIHAGEKLRQGLPCRRLMAADGHLVHTQFTGLDHAAILGDTVFG